MNKEQLLLKLKSLTEEKSKLELNIKDIEQQILDFPKETLEEEFYDWYKYAEKIDYSYIISKDKAPLIREIASDWLERYQTISSSDLLDMIEGDEIDNNEELMKEMIKVNFGSMVYDW